MHRATGRGCHLYRPGTGGSPVKAAVRIAKAPCRAGIGIRCRHVAAGRQRLAEPFRDQRQVKVLAAPAGRETPLAPTPADFRGEEPAIGVFLCTCEGFNEKQADFPDGADVIDVGCEPGDRARLQR